jgi:CHASE3 domain sensor protein
MAFSIRRLKIRQQIQLVILPPLFALLCALSVLFYSFWMSRLTERSVRKSQESLAQIERVSRQFTEMHSAVRDYLLTGDQAALAPYDLGMATLPAELDRLRELESGSDTDRAAGDALGNEIKRWQAEWADS